MPFSAKALTSRSVVSCARAAARNEQRRQQGRETKEGAGVRRFMGGASRRVPHRARGGLPTLPRPRHGGQGVCLEPAGGGAYACLACRSAARPHRDELGAAHVRARGVIGRAHGFAGTRQLAVQVRLADAVANVGARHRHADRNDEGRPALPGRNQLAERRATSVSSRTSWRDRVEPLVGASGNDCIASPGRASSRSLRAWRTCLFTSARETGSDSLAARATLAAAARSRR